MSESPSPEADRAGEFRGDLALYVWDDAVFVVAHNAAEARGIAARRVKDVPGLRRLVGETEPKMVQYPAAHVVFR